MQIKRDGFVMQTAYITVDKKDIPNSVDLCTVGRRFFLFGLLAICCAVFAGLGIAVAFLCGHTVTTEGELEEFKILFPKQENSYLRFGGYALLACICIFLMWLSPGLLFLAALLLFAYLGYLFIKMLCRLIGKISFSKLKPKQPEFVQIARAWLQAKRQGICTIVEVVD